MTQEGSRDVCTTHGAGKLVPIGHADRNGAKTLWVKRRDRPTHVIPEDQPMVGQVGSPKNTISIKQLRGSVNWEVYRRQQTSTRFI